MIHNHTGSKVAVNKNDAVEMVSLLDLSKFKKRQPGIVQEGTTCEADFNDFKRGNFDQCKIKQEIQTVIESN